MTCALPWRGTLSGYFEKPLAQHAAELQHGYTACLGHRAGTFIKAKLSIEDRSPSTLSPSCCWPGIYRIHSLGIQTRKPVFCQNRHPDLARLGNEKPVARATRLAAKRGEVGGKGAGARVNRLFPTKFYSSESSEARWTPSSKVWIYNHPFQRVFQPGSPSPLRPK